MSEVDITAQIKAIEALKCALLTDVAVLYESMRKPMRQEERDEPLSDMLVNLYLLAKKLGLDFARLDDLAAQRLRRAALGKNGAPDAQALLKYLSSRRGKRE